MKFLVFAVLLSLVGVIPAFAESQTLPTDGGTLDVKLEYDEIVPGDLTALRTDFINPQTGQIQVHIDWNFSVYKEGKVVWGPTPLSHTSEGSLKNLRYEFPSDGIYTVEFGVEGILFQPIPKEVVSFEVMVGDTVVEESLSAIPDWIKNNARWWAEGIITDSDFITGIQYLIQNEILVVPPTATTGNTHNGIPDWVKNNAGWWAQDLISDDDFVNGIQYLIGAGLISVDKTIQTATLEGQFEDADFVHRTSGTARVTIQGESKTLDLANFETTSGPDLFVYLSADKTNRDYVDIGMLDRFKGAQKYDIPDSVDIVKYHNVLIWCKSFGVLFGSAELFVVEN